MELSNANVLITGGSEGIGKSLAKRFLAAGSRVIFTGRNKEKLQRAANELPGLEFLVNDIAGISGRDHLAAYIQQNMPGINVLINNAGIQRRVALALDTERQTEIDILLAAPIHLNHLLVPVILAHRQASLIVNVTSGGAYIPQVFAPVYSACKAALHSYTMTLRHSLAGTPCRVVELIPPAVQTGLAGGNTNHRMSLEVFADAVFEKMITDNVTEVGYGMTENISVKISGRAEKEVFTDFSQRFPVMGYSGQ